MRLQKHDGGRGGLAGPSLRFGRQGWAVEGWAGGRFCSGTLRTDGGLPTLRPTVSAVRQPPGRCTRVLNSLIGCGWGVGCGPSGALTAYARDSRAGLYQLWVQLIFESSL